MEKGKKHHRSGRRETSVDLPEELEEGEDEGDEQEKDGKNRGRKRKKDPDGTSIDLAESPLKHQREKGIDHGKKKEKRVEPAVQESFMNEGGDVKKEKKSAAYIAVAIGSCILLIGGIGAILPLTQGSGPSKCKILADQMSGEKEPDELSPLELSECMRGTCDFDVKTCEISCPFGFETNERGCVISCNCAMEGVYQGDIAFVSSQLDTMLEDFGHVKKKEDDFAVFFSTRVDIWNNIEKNGRFQIPFNFDESVSADLAKIFWEAVHNMSKFTCLDYVARTDEEHFVDVHRFGNGCTGTIGRIGFGDRVTLPEGCFYESIIQHELAHTLGFHHEQCRPDRDGYVDVFEDNIEKSKLHNFDKKQADQLKSLGSQYELMSGMHYQSYDFTIDKTKPAITGKGDVILDRPSSERFLTLEDFNEINLLYECELDSEKKGEWTDWGEWSDCAVTCGEGLRNRFRKCIHQPTGDNIPSGCEEMPMEFEECAKEECPVYDWDDWLDWTDCSQTCGLGLSIRYRKCPVRNACPGFEWIHEKCMLKDCKTGKVIINNEFGEWNEWNTWSICYATCGKGDHLRDRRCYQGEMSLDAKFCHFDPAEGERTATNMFQLKECEAPITCPPGMEITTTPFPENTAGPAPQGEGDSDWGAWGDWSECDRSCGGSMRQRKRTCSTNYCEGKPDSEEPCKKPACPGQAMFKEEGSTGFNMCMYGILLVGKFDDDDAHDLICVYGDGFVRVHASSPGSRAPISEKCTWEGKIGGCFFDMSKDKKPSISLRDVNGDGRDDLLCVNEVTNEVEVTLNSKKGYSRKIDWKGSRGSCKVFRFEEATGDGKPDMICGTEENPFKHVFANTNTDGG